jgi:hypothetical protein
MHKLFFLLLCFICMASRIQIGKTVTVKGKSYKIVKPTAKGKKYKAVPVSGKGRSIHFGAKGYTVAPGTPRGNNYCARSSGIKSSKPGASANDFARMLWNCKGKTSQKK